MKKRIAIYCYYSVKGIAYQEVCNQVKDLRKNVKYLVVVVNGEINNKEMFSCADKIVVRENKGLDAGAYKEILFMPEIINMLKNYEELVLCNSTFWGPFTGFKHIFDEMEKRDLDFWGISNFDNGFIRHIQSFFLVFGNKILIDPSFYDYWKQNIDASCVAHKEVCYWFENGLFELLTKKYTYGSYIENVGYNIYQNPHKCIEKGLPILKKKIFNQIDFIRDKKICALKLIEKKYNYCINTILNEIEGEYGTDITLKEIIDYKIPDKINAEKYYVGKKTMDELISFVCNNENIYIFGTGNYAYNVYQIIKKYCRVRGFVVSDENHRTALDYYGEKIFTLDELEKIPCVSIVIGLFYDNTNMIKTKLKRIPNVYNLWE